MLKAFAAQTINDLKVMTRDELRNNILENSQLSFVIDQVKQGVKLIETVDRADRYVNASPLTGPTILQINFDGKPLEAFPKILEIVAYILKDPKINGNANNLNFAGRNILITLPRNSLQSLSEDMGNLETKLNDLKKATNAAKKV